MKKTQIRKTARTSSNKKASATLPKSAVSINGFSRINSIHYVLAFIFFVSIIVFASSVTFAEEAPVETPAEVAETVVEVVTEEESMEPEAPIEPTEEPIEEPAEVGAEETTEETPIETAPEVTSEEKPVDLTEQPTENENDETIAPLKMFSSFASSPIPEDEENTEEAPICPFEPKEGRTIVNFPPDQYTGDRFLIMYGAGHPQKRGPYEVDLAPGTYKVTLFGYDAYPGRSLLAPWDLQEYEAWHVTFFDENGTAVASSSNTTDLEDGVDYAESTDVVDMALEIIAPIKNIFTYHIFNNEENIEIPKLAEHNIPNSVNPICAAFDLIPTTPKGNLFIKKYSCTPDTVVTREANGPDLGGNHIAPQSCVAEEGVRFGYIHQADKNDGSGPYPGYDDGAVFNVIGETSPEGGVSLAGMDAVGRYNIAIIDEDANRVPDNEAGLLGMYCYGDTGTPADSYDFAFVLPNETGWCIVYNNNRDDDDNGGGNGTTTPKNNPPFISLIGSSTINLIVGDTFVDPGVTYGDPDGDSPLVLASSTDPIGGVTTSTTSVFLITYSVTDPMGLSATTTRTVNVNPSNTNGDGGNGGGGGGNDGGDDDTSTSTPSGTTENTDSNTSSRGGGSRRGGSVLGAFTNNIGQVLGASTSCSLYLNEYIKAGAKNNPEEVTKLQIFLNEYMGENIPVTGTYGPLSLEAVKRFQLMWRKEVLKPWVGVGLHTSEDEPTGYVYKTTRRQINNIVCPELNLPLPELN